ncbi:MAG: SAM-dependent chlorinase/fluorinase [Dehalococcoidales bacterium]|nr:SAM-dependent chlorinase/fluorinase [Dehalococcoidales bacterium]
MNPIITLTTDFGLTDAYVAAMKGVILGINPEAKLVDICHTIKPQNIAQAAFVLSRAYPFFPEGTIHVVVVDPGVGTERRAIILRTKSADFVAPDNGVLSYVIQQFIKGRLKGRSPFKNHSSPSCKEDIPIMERGTEGVRLINNLQQIELESGLEAVAITKPQFWRSTVSPTFHGRDIFAPVAARLSLGFPLTDFGEVITSVTMLPLPHPYQAVDGSVVGHVIHIDIFGNLITDIKSNDLPQARQAITIEVGNQLISGLSRTYAEGSGLLALIGSDGYLEIALKGGGASAFLDAGVGDEVIIR